MIEQHTIPPWYVTYLPGLLAYVAGVACSYGGTQMLKMVYASVISKRELRLFAFSIGFFATSYVWWAWYGMSINTLAAGIMAGVTAPIAWDAWRHWLNRKPAKDEHGPDDDKTDPIWRDK